MKSFLKTFSNNSQTFSTQSQVVTENSTSVCMQSAGVTAAAASSVSCPTEKKLAQSRYVTQQTPFFQLRGPNSPFPSVSWHDAACDLVGVYSRHVLFFSSINQYLGKKM